MAGVAPPLALPRGWPRGLRSAAVHAVSIAEFALTTALGWAAQSLNPRLHPRAEIEPCIRTIKHECTRRLVLVPYRLAAMEQELAVYFSWYNGHRPHSRLGAVTPDETYHHWRRAYRTPRFEPRPRWPRRSPCASPQALIRGQPGVTPSCPRRRCPSRSPR